jgi:hypothetical protein
MWRRPYVYIHGLRRILYSVTVQTESTKAFLIGRCHTVSRYSRTHIHLDYMQISYTQSERNRPEICRTSVDMLVRRSVQRDCYSNGLHDTHFRSIVFFRDNSGTGFRDNSGTVFCDNSGTGFCDNSGTGFCDNSGTGFRDTRQNSTQTNHQPDTTIFQFIILAFISSSTCFGCSPAHHQELNKCSSSLWFYLRIVVTAVLCSWSGQSARPRTQHVYHHDKKVKPEAATAVVELLMMGGRTPETC